VDAGWAQALATILAVVVGAVLSVYVRGQQLLKIGEKRMDAYATLWELTQSLRRNGPFLTDTEFAELAEQMTAWYYHSGAGMLATAETVDIFLKLRNNLTCATEDFYPESWVELWQPLEPGETLPERRRALLARQFSILRTQLKMDCSIYYGRHVSPERLVGPYEVDLLQRLSAKPARAWRRQIRRADTVTREQYLLQTLGLGRSSAGRDAPAGTP
jgi:hypothetical protein